MSLASYEIHYASLDVIVSWLEHYVDCDQGRENSAAENTKSQAKVFAALITVWQRFCELHIVC